MASTGRNQGSVEVRKSGCSEALGVDPWKVMVSRFNRLVITLPMNRVSRYSAGQRLSL